MLRLPLLRRTLPVTGRTVTLLRSKALPEEPEPLEVTTRFVEEEVFDITTDDSSFVQKAVDRIVSASPDTLSRLGKCGVVIKPHVDLAMYNVDAQQREVHVSSALVRDARHIGGAEHGENMMALLLAHGFAELLSEHHAQVLPSKHLAMVVTAGTMGGLSATTACYLQLPEAPILPMTFFSVFSAFTVGEIIRGYNARKNGQGISEIREHLLDAAEFPTVIGGIARVIEKQLDTD